MSKVTKRANRNKVTTWALWDWASAAFNAVVTTFVFSVYISNANLFGDNANTNLGYTMTAAGIFVAIIAPVVGQSVDRSGKRRKLIFVSTLITILATGGLALVRPDESYLWLGLLLLAVGNIAFETGSVVYNAILADISTPRTIGRISGLGWGLGYVGGIVLMLILYVGLIGPEIGWFGVTSDDGMSIRVAMIFCAIWTLVFSLPLMLTASDTPPKTSEKVGIIGSYRALFTSIKHLWKKDRSLVWFLGSSALFRDGLAGVFAYGGVLAAAAFGFTEDEVLIFGIVANLVAGIATISFGYLDDRVGARLLILFSLGSMLVLGMIIFILHDAGQMVFWICGLLLCVFVGPTQSSSRTYLARIIPPGEEGEVFGLYATTGRAVSFLSPFMYSTAITIGAALTGSSKEAAAHFGILGIVLVLLSGFITFFFIRPNETGNTER